MGLGSDMPNMRASEGISNLAAAIVAIPLVLLSTWLYAFAGAVLWHWYIASTFGIRPIGVATAYGIGALAQLFFIMPKSLRATALEKDFMQRNVARSAGHLCGVLFLRPAGTLFIAWIVKVLFL